MPTQDPTELRLLGFNRDVLSQALALVAAHDAPHAPAFAHPVGAHIRHVVEHYEALLNPLQQGVVDYDARPRDAALERSPQVARQRLAALLLRLSAAPSGLLLGTLDTPLRVRGRAGLGGDFGFEVGSTLGRELVFAASHAIHHFAVLTPHCQAHGLAVGSHFGKAPATVAHERENGVTNSGPAQTNPHHNPPENPCKLQPQTA